MKKLMMLIVLLVVAEFAEAQVRSTWVAARHFRTGETYASWAHDSTGGTTDTMQAIPVYNVLEIYYAIRALDSASITVSYQPSYDGVNWGAPVVIDSLSTAAATSKSILLPSGAMGLHSVRFVRTVNVFRLGVTIPTLMEQIQTKR